ncbi:MAG: NAD(P)/FAD-dependent oxidoreductase [Gammaproteobacteria bacterium]|nr:NAD(P)/FAD-dependent oxidoreductase [Gammaproteobacteria bacterium]
MPEPDHFDVAIIGAGVIGLAIAQRLSTADFMSNRSVLLLDQETSFGHHTSSRNSEVIHAGLYYPSGSMKAHLCVRGKELLYEHCQQFHVPHRQLGKLIVAGSAETGELERLMNQGNVNGVADLVILEGDELAALEPAVSGTAALFSPSSGIIDAHEFMVSLLRLAEDHGAVFAPRTRVVAVDTADGDFSVETQIAGDTRYQFRCTSVINCAGLEATLLARKIDGVDEAVIPELHLCKGDYFSYQGASPFKHLIYPLPESNTVGLGIHATLDLAGRIRFGPDTTYLSDIDYRVRADKAAAFAEAISSYFPSIETSRLNPDYSGIRPKLAGPGESPADFMIQQVDQHGVPGLIQLFGIESPGLTASLAIAEQVRDSLQGWL